jgi:hypothetical protein
MSTPAPAPKLSEKHALMVAELGRLEDQLGKLHREEKVGQKLAYALSPLAIVALFVTGWLAAALVLVSAAALWATVTYLVFVRRREYQLLARDTQRDLSRAGVRY